MNNKKKIFQNEEQVEEIIEKIPLRRSTREIQPSTNLRDFVTYKVYYPLQNFISYTNISKYHRAFLMSIKRERAYRIL
jgi:hypothetical protein